MPVQEVSITLPDDIYQRLESAARALDRPISEILLRAIEVGSPPGWDDVPDEYRDDLADMDELDNESLLKIVHRPASKTERKRHEDLLNQNADSELGQEQQSELASLRVVADKHMLERSHAISLLRWRWRDAV